MHRLIAASSRRSPIYRARRPGDADDLARGRDKSGSYDDLLPLLITLRSRAFVLARRSWYSASFILPAS
jgi:hypothetical protein